MLTLHATAATGTGRIRGEKQDRFLLKAEAG